MVDTELMGRDPLMGMIVEEVGADNVGPDINTVRVSFSSMFPFVQNFNFFRPTSTQSESFLSDPGPIIVYPCQ